MTARRTLTAAAVALSVGLGVTAAVLVPRLTEVGRVASILRGDTLDYGGLHATEGDINGVPHRLLSYPLAYEAGLDSVLWDDPEFQRLMALNLLHGPRLDRGSVVFYGDQRIRSIVPVPHQPDVVYVATEGFYVSRDRWSEIEGRLP